MTSDDWLPAMPLVSDRLQLEPLRVEHAEEMAPVLEDARIHTFMGGEPHATAAELRIRYAQQAVGCSEDGSQGWLNWVARRRDDAGVVGFIQATVTREDGELCAEVAWVIGTAHQHCGYAREAAGVMADWLTQHGVRTLVAHIHPDHHASNAVARGMGLVPTDDLVDGEVRWLGRTGDPSGGP